MKKIIFLLLCLFPLWVKAEVNYDITDYYVSSEIEIAGAIKVKELIVLDGTFNGYEREIVIKDTSLKNWEEKNINFEKSSIYNCLSVDNLKVATFNVDKVNLKTFNNIKDFAKLVDKANNGDSDVYTVTETKNGQNVKMYKKSDNQKVAFYLEYVVTNAVVMHEDVAELYYPYVGSNFSDPIDHVVVQVYLPYADNSDKFRIWAHGPLNGEAKKILNEKKENVGVVATTKNLKANTGFDIRMTFDKSLIQIPQFLDNSKETALPKIIKVEKQRANEANKSRQQIRFVYYGILTLIIAYLIGLVILWLYIYFKHDREYRSDFKSKYNRDFIDDYNVEVIDYLNNKNISANALSASIMNLVYKKNIKVEEIASKDKKEKKQYKFILQNKDNLTEAEKYLIDFLFLTIGKDNEFKLSDLKDYASSSSSYLNFNTRYNSWKNKVIAEGEKQEFYEDKNFIKKVGILYFCLGIVLAIVAFFNTNSLMWLYLFPSIIFLIYTLSFNKRSKKGNDHYKKWQAFKNFLNDFGNFEIKELPEIALWERYMVYAVIFNLAKKVQKAMNVKIKEYDINNTMYTPYINNWLYYDMQFNIANTISNAVSSSISAANAQSLNSSGSGFGGGFSSGSGGGFGGGGGGHGF